MTARRLDADGLDNRDFERIRKLGSLIQAVTIPYHRAEVRGLSRIPTGAALYVANHSSGPMLIDSFIFCAEAFRSHGLGGLPFILAHDKAVSVGMVAKLLLPLGVIRASHENAGRAFRAGHKVLVYPGGDSDGLRPFRDRHKIRFGGHNGYVRLALRNRVPIVPVVSCGSHSAFIVIDDLPWLARLLRLDRSLRLHVFPLTWSVPWGLTLGPPPPYLPLPTRIKIEVLDPIHLDAPPSSDVDGYVADCAARVEAAMQTTLTNLATGT